jgi:type IV pilus assembly protein PilC
VEEFKYKARRRDGSMVTGIVTAPNEAAVAAYIQRQNMYVAGISKSDHVDQAVLRHVRKGY